MNKPDLISILMPVKNSGELLKYCLNSMLRQQLINWELIAINDHSNDQTSSILYKYASIDSRIKFFTNRGTGIIDALQHAFSISTGNYITRMDADDIMHKNKLQELYQLVKNRPGYLATALVKYFAAKKIGDGYKKYEQWLNQLTKDQNNFSEIYRECVIPSPCWMVAKKDLTKINAFNNLNYPEDYDLCFKFYQQQLKIVSSKNTLHYWRDYPDRTSRTDSNYTDQSFLDLKLKYFFKIDYQGEPLFLWGAGPKGKQVAKKLIQLKKEFIWICNNPKKEGKNIYDQKIYNYTHLDNYKKPCVISAVSSPQGYTEISNFLPKTIRFF